MRSWLALALIGCSSGEDPTKDELTTDAPETDPPVLAGDVDAVRELVAGARAVDDVVAEVAWQGGWPAVDDGAAWFVYVGDGGPWSVAGDFSAWEPVPMTEGDGFWYAEVPVDVAAGARYKFTDGEAWIADPWARSYTYDDQGEMSYVRPPTDTWRLDRWVGLLGTGQHLGNDELLPRDLRVYVPPGDGPFPALYFHDGQNLFDPDGIWGGWHLQDALSDADRPILAIGIDNTADRMEEYTPTDDLGYQARGDAYLALIVEDIMPIIESTYPTDATDGIVGSSLGGLISIYAGEQYPDVFDFVGSLSGTLSWGRIEDEHPTMEERYFSAGPNGVPMYVDSGGGPPRGGCQDGDDRDMYAGNEGNDEDNYCANRGFVDTLAGVGWMWEENLWHWHEDGAPHNEAAWAARVHRPIDIFAALAP